MNINHSERGIDSVVSRVYWDLTTNISDVNRQKSKSNDQRCKSDANTFAQMKRKRDDNFTQLQKMRCPTVRVSSFVLFYVQI